MCKLKEILTALLTINPVLLVTYMNQPETDMIKRIFTATNDLMATVRREQFIFISRIKMNY